MPDWVTDFRAGIADMQCKLLAISATYMNSARGVGRGSH